MPRLIVPQILKDVSKIANNQFGQLVQLTAARLFPLDVLRSFVITKLIGYPNMYRETCDAILEAYPPVATSHHGVNFAKIALQEGGRNSIAKYLDALCANDAG
jgi:hypothetical protein